MTCLQFYHLESSAKNTDILMSGSAVKSQREMFVPVVPGLSSSSGASSSSASFPQDSSSTSSSPARLRSDEEASGNRRDAPKIQNRHQSSDNWEAAGNRL